MSVILDLLELSTISKNLGEVEMSIARNALLSPIEPAKATDQVIQRISEAISSGVLNPGDRLPPEAELAQLLDVAQMTLRQALEILRGRGYIETVRGRNGGSFITKQVIKFSDPSTAASVRLKDLQDLIDFRMAIGNEAAALAAIRATDLDLENLALHLENCLNHEQNKKDHWLADNSLHVAIVEATGSTRMIKAASTAQYELTIFFQQLFPNYESHKLHFEEHRKIIQAIKSGDPDAAWDASNQHLLSEYNYFAQLVAE